MEKISSKKTKPLFNGQLSFMPPHAPEIEEVVLGGLMIDSNCVAEGMTRLFPEIFYLPANELVFTAIQQIYDKGIPIDIISVIEQLRKNEVLDIVGGIYYVTKLTNSVISGANIEAHIRLLSEYYLKREMIKIGTISVSEAYDSSTDAFDLIGKTDEAIVKIQERVITGMSTGVLSYGMKVLEQHAQVKETGVLGISTGLKDLDTAICGLVSPDLIILAARPSQGKTAFALSITYNTSITGDIPCAWFSLEMDGVQLVRRLASIDSGISHQRIREGKSTTEEDKKLYASIEKITNSKIFIEDKTAMNIRDIRTKAALLKKKHNIKYIIVDYIQLMQGTDIKGKNREQIISDISRQLKLIAKELEIPVIGLSQLSREVEKRSDKMPQLSDLRESGAIEQDADSVIFLMRPEYYKFTEDVTIGGKDYPVAGLAIVSIEKNRHGNTKTIPMKFTGHLMHFTDVDNQEITVLPDLMRSYINPADYKDDNAPF